MKYSGCCPKCDSAEISIIPGSVYNQSTKITLVFKSIKLDRMICTHCGYTEEWIQRAKDLEYIKRKFGMITPDNFV